MTPVRVLIADDNALLRQGIRSLFEARLEWQVVGEAANGREAVEKAMQLRPDIALMDISMPELNGIEATRQIVKSVPGTEVLILTMDESEKTMREALEAGARGYILKSDPPTDLFAAIDDICKRKHFVIP
jgi:DNA-binding NarL/FixJ family response regulator